MVDRLPESLVSRFVVALRDVLWFKKQVHRFLERAGVPSEIMDGLNPDDPTISKARRVVDLLEQSGQNGRKVLERLLAELSDWQDLSHFKDPEKKAQAIESRRELKKEIIAYADRVRYQQKKERDQHEERLSRGKIGALDHRKLESFRSRFDGVSGLLR